MVTFNFSAITKKSKTSRKKESINDIIIVEEKVRGTVELNSDNEYVVNYNNKFYDITKDSYDTKGKRCVYTRTKDKYNHRIKIIRDKEAMIKLNSKFYCPFGDKSIVIGNIVKTNFGQKMFKIIKVLDISG